MNDQSHYIQPEQLCIGLYVHLDLGWMDHPFTFSNFKIKDQKQVDKLRALQLGQIRYDPLRSDRAPLPLPAEPEIKVAAEEPPPPPPPPKAEPARLKMRAERLMQLRRMVDSCEKDFAKDAQSTRTILRQLAFKPEESRAAAETLVTKLVNSAVTEQDVVLHAIGANPDNYIHSLNVTVLSLMMAKTLDMSDADAHDLGLAALFHDVSKGEGSHHQSYRNQHCEQGARMALDAGLSERVAKLILQHHENIDGSGYPQRLMRDQIDPLARVLSLVNTYDNLCNPLNPAHAMTPYETLAHLYTSEFNKFEPSYLKLLIKSLGVYPPGSVVQLSNGSYGLVMTVNPTKPLLPLVMLYLPKVASQTPVIFDLSEQEGISISKCLRPAQLPKEVYDYLRPSKRVCYYFLNKDEDQQSTAPQVPPAQKKPLQQAAT
jgi:putative nucleotidyltransferase with HDIG domain